MWPKQSLQMQKMKMTTHGRRTILEDNLKILIVETIINHWSDHVQISNLSLCDHNKVYKFITWRWPPLEDDLNWKTTSKFWIMEYLSNHWSDHAQFFNFSLCDQNNVYKCITCRWPPMEDDLNWKTTSNSWKWTSSATTDQIMLKFRT